MNFYLSSIYVPNTVLWIIFGITILLAVIASVILFYHWRRYGRGLVTNTWAFIYFIILLILLISEFGLIQKLTS